MSSHDEPDYTELALARWAELVPGVDPSPLAIMLRLRRAASLLEHRMEQIFLQRGLGAVGDYDLLSALRRAKSPLTPSELAEMLLVTRSGVSGRLSRLEREGFVSRQSDPRDGRGALLSLTRRGRSTVDSLYRAVCEIQAEALAGVDDSLRTCLSDGLKDLVVALGEPRSPADGPGRDPGTRSPPRPRPARRPGR